MDTVGLTMPRDISWQIHSRGLFSDLKSPKLNAWNISFPGWKPAQLVLYEPTSGSVMTGPSEFIPAYPHDGAGDFFLRCSVRGDHVRFLWVLLLADEPIPVFSAGDGPSLRFGDGTRLLAREHALVRA
jgi:hypothetical protein